MEVFSNILHKAVYADCPKGVLVVPDFLHVHFFKLLDRNTLALIMSKGFDKSKPRLALVDNVTVEIHPNVRTPLLQIGRAQETNPDPAHALFVPVRSTATQSSEIMLMTSQVGVCSNVVMSPDGTNRVSSLYATMLTFGMDTAVLASPPTPKMWLRKNVDHLHLSSSADPPAAAPPLRATRTVKEPKAGTLKGPCKSGMCSSPGGCQEGPPTPKLAKLAKVITGRGRESVCASCTNKIAGKSTRGRLFTGATLGRSLRSGGSELMKRLAAFTAPGVVGHPFTNPGSIAKKDEAQALAVQFVNGSIARTDYGIHIATEANHRPAVMARLFYFGHVRKTAGFMYLMSPGQVGPPQNLARFMKAQGSTFGYCGYTETTSDDFKGVNTPDQQFLPHDPRALVQPAGAAAGDKKASRPGRYAMAAFETGSAGGVPRIVSMSMINALKAIRNGQRVRVLVTSSRCRHCGICSTGERGRPIHALREPLLPKVEASPPKYSTVHQGQFLTWSMLHHHLKVRSFLSKRLPPKDRPPLLIEGCLEAATDTVTWEMKHDQKVISARFGYVFAWLVREALSNDAGAITAELGPDCDFTQYTKGTADEAAAIRATTAFNTLKAECESEFSCHRIDSYPTLIFRL